MIEEPEIERSACQTTVRRGDSPLSECAGVGEDGHRSLFFRILEIVKNVPYGKVSTYGQIASIVGISDARKVGFALSSLKEGQQVPWHRIVNAAGKISLKDPLSAEYQKKLLEAEGVVFREDDSVDLSRYLWQDPE